MLLKFKKKLTRFYNDVWLLFLITACGGSGENKSENSLKGDLNGLSKNYVPPLSDYTHPTEVDENFKVLETETPDPYWINALTMHEPEVQLDPILELSGHTMKYAFPSETPIYLSKQVVQWAPVSDEIKAASKEVFTKINNVLEVQFIETSDIYGMDVVAISQSSQDKTAGFSYFPNNYFEIGSDVFISNNNSQPSFLNNVLTNYDYEVLVHEIGHSIGLKHPFESDGDNTTILAETEDSSLFTVMTYNSLSHTFNGNFRPLDWLALTKLYGVNDNFNSGSNTYYFSDLEGIMIVDGAGLDLVDASDHKRDTYIDLRPGAHSYIGEAPANNVTSPSQLTISHDSVIEYVYTGTGSDYIIANEVSNLIVSGSGNDKIFPSEGEDTVHAGLGLDIVDLSEIVQSMDIIILTLESEHPTKDTIYGFKQGSDGDVVVIENYSGKIGNILPVISLESVPLGLIHNQILRLVGENLETTIQIENFFEEQNKIDNLKIINEKPVLVLTSNTKETGEGQSLFCIEKNDESFSTSHLATFIGNHLDLDMWSDDNFGYYDAAILA